MIPDKCVLLVLGQFISLSDLNFNIGELPVCSQGIKQFHFCIGGTE